MMINLQILLPLIMKPLTAVLASEPLIVQSYMLKYNKGLIANGVFYNPLEYPYVVTFTYAVNENSIVSCTGTLLTKLFVLTAAHCTHDRSAKKIRVLAFSYYIIVLTNIIYKYFTGVPRKYKIK